MSSELQIIFYVLLCFVAILYASVGHGGASGYIALMTLFNFAPEQIRTKALILNVVVSCIAFIQYAREEKINWQLAMPLLIASIPLAYLGATIKIDTQLFKILLAIVLLVPIFRFLGFFKQEETAIETPKWFILVMVGAAIGFISGIIGIGGGILLTPLLLYFSWSSVRQASLLSALFILLNSISGLIAIKENVVQETESIYILLIAVVIGGIIGSYAGVKIFNSQVLKRILAIVLLIAVIKLIST
jgi:uncharacterized membrane protein YfcA